MTEKRAKLFIHIMLAIQMALPLSYYVARADQNDERFAWRMFSTVRMLRCQPRFAVGDEQTPVPLNREFHEAWWRTAERGRKVVVTAMAHALCDRARDKGDDSPRVQVELTCTGLDGTTERHGGGWNMCNLDSL